MKTRILTAKYIYSPKSSFSIENGFIEVDSEGRIVSSGNVEDLPEGTDREYFDGALVPGFVNTHNHVELSHMHHRMPKGTGMAKFVDIITEIRDFIPIERKVELTRHWMDELYRQGVSAMGDISNDSYSFAIKAVHPMYTRTFLEVFASEPEDCPKMMARVAELQKQADACGIDAAPTPHACYSTSPQLLREVSAAGLKSGYLSFHCEESIEEEMIMMDGNGPLMESRKRQGLSMPPSKKGRSALEYFIEELDEAGVVPAEGNMLLVHEVCMTEDGAKKAAKAFRHPYVALCPLSNLYIHNQLPPVNEMRSWPVKLTVGTDSLSSNDTLNMVDELYCLQKNFDISMQELIEWACLNGAEFLGKADMLGNFSVGKKPGVVFISNLSEDGRLTEDSKSERII